MTPLRLKPARLGPGLLLALAAVLLAAPFARAQDPAPPPQGVRYVYLVRHGDYDVVKHVDDRVLNGLNALGHEQAKLLGQRLAQLPVKMNTLVCSNYTRARETAQDIGAILHLAPVEDSLLHECTPPSDRPDYTMNHQAGEITLCESNLEAAWHKYMTPSPDADRRDVLVCHGNVIRWLTCKAIGADTRRWFSMDIGNASVTVIAVRPDSTTRLVEFSDVGHLPPAKQTWTGRGAGWVEPKKK